MEITWQQVLVEAIGFGLVWWGFSKFLVGPITKVLDDRAIKVRSDLGRAHAHRQEMESLKTEYEERLRQVEDEVRGRLADSVKRGEEIILEMEAKAQEVAEKIRKRAEAEVEEMRLRLRREIREDTARLVAEVSRRFLSTRLVGEDDALIARLMEEVSPSVET